ncbi:MAG: L-histidine N(alpha)-methyltransferase [Actinomycetota bacterium]|nr:L-histidine N(alpha)-methyltransferase [Actinomycetota bacterium]
MSSIADDVRQGLTVVPKDLPPKWFYDARGSALFDEITRLPEYYPTRAEAAILDKRADEIARATRAETLIELGSGTSEKTRLLIDALLAGGTLHQFVPFDVSDETLHGAAAALEAEYPGLAVRPVAGDFDHDLHRIPHAGRRLVAFLGGTIGNFLPEHRAAFLAEIGGALDPGDHFLLGTDLVKDIGRLEAAYDDSAGVTAEFNKNVLHVMNRELDADFDPDRFEHVAFFDKENEWIEMRLRAVDDHVVTVRALDLVVPFAAGEEMRTEVSAKFRREGIERELAHAGLRLVEWWTDPDDDFALSLSTTA